MTPWLILPVLAVAVGLILVLFSSGAGARRLTRRARRIATPNRVSKVPVGPQLRVNRPGGLDVFVGRLLPRPALLRQRLASTGTPLSIGAYALICINLAIGVALLAILKGMPPIIALLAGTLCGLLLPHLAVGWLVSRRRKKFSKFFPDAIGLMVRGLKAGLPVTESLLVVGREVSDPVGEEFRRVGDQVRLGQAIEDALWAVAKRLDLAEFNFLVVTMSIQRETGGNLAETLENLDDMLRKRHQMKLKIKAMSSEAMATAMIIGSLPFVMSAILFLVSRAYIMTLFNTDLGRIMLGGGLFWMSIGIFVMSQMIKFEI
jgi:tight adherence protein B